MRSSEHVRLAFLLSALGVTAGRGWSSGRAADAADSYRWLWISGLFAVRDGDLSAARARLATLSGMRRGGVGAALRDLFGPGLARGGPRRRARDGFAALVGSGRLMEDWYAYEDSPAPRCATGWRAPAGARRHRRCLGRAGRRDRLGFERLRHPVTWTLAGAARRAELQLDPSRRAAPCSALHAALGRGRPPASRDEDITLLRGY
jgi:hypothetical protein